MDKKSFSIICKAIFANITFFGWLASWILAIWWNGYRAEWFYTGLLLLVVGILTAIDVEAKGGK